MSEFLQSGLHPDADQLNAFVEHALPQHEREQTLAHLAVCSTCRAVVSLSMPVVEVHHPQPEPARRPWFLGWNLLWPVGAAIATLIPILFYVHQTATHNPVATPAQVAESHAPAPPATPPAAAPQPADKAQAPPAAMPKPAPSPTIHTASAPAPAAPPAAAASPAVPVAAPHPSVDTKDATPGGTMENEAYSQLPLSMNGGPRDSAASRSRTPGSPENPGAAGRAANNGNSGIYGGTGQTNLNENYVENVPVTNIARQGSSNPAAESSDAAVSIDALTQTLAMADASSDEALATLAESAARQAPLPSGLPTLSTAANGRLTVALDTGNTLFLSYDSGRRWRPVSSPWKGRAVRVELASAPPSQMHGLAMKAQSGFGGARAGAAPARAMAGASAGAPGIQGIIVDPNGSVVSGAEVIVTNTDTGAQARQRTTETGTYSLRSLPPGPYNVEVVARGFQRLLQEKVIVDNASMVSLNLKLGVGGENTTVTVTSAPPSPSTTDATPAAPAATAPVASRAVAKTPAPPPPAVASAAPASSTPLFVVTTESGDRWTSPDGRTWTRR